MVTGAARSWPRAPIRATMRAAQEGQVAFYELRQYRVMPGKMDQWVRYMEEVIIPFQVARGMVIAGSFRGEQDDTTYVWLRRFESEAERERLYAAVYEADEWEQEISPQVGALIDRSAIQVTRLVATSRSVLR